MARKPYLAADKADEGAERKREFYHNQRIDAEKRAVVDNDAGAQAEVGKIFGKLGKGAAPLKQQYDKNKAGADSIRQRQGAISASTGFAAGGELGNIGGSLLSHVGGAVLKRLFPEAAEHIESLLPGGVQKMIGGFPQTESNALRNAGQRALPAGRRALGPGRAEAPKAVTPKTRNARTKAAGDKPAPTQRAAKTKAAGPTKLTTKTAKKPKKVPARP